MDDVGVRRRLADQTPLQQLFSCFSTHSHVTNRINVKKLVLDITEGKRSSLRRRQLAITIPTKEHLADKKLSLFLK